MMISDGNREPFAVKNPKGTTLGEELFTPSYVAEEADYATDSEDEKDMAEMGRNQSHPDRTRTAKSEERSSARPQTKAPNPSTLVTGRITMICQSGVSYQEPSPSIKQRCQHARR